MSEWLGFALDVVLICVVGFGIIQAVRLIRQLQDLRAGRAEMDRFVRDFNAAVMRAEAGIKSLRAAARESGDDLEKLVDKAVMVRDELNFIVESADSVAERLSVTTSNVLNGDLNNSKTTVASKNASPPPVDVPPTSKSATAQAPTTQPAPSSKAEQELLQALKKLS